MHTVVFSHSLYQDGMKFLEGKVNVKILNTFNARDVEREVVATQAEGVVTRGAPVDRQTIFACERLRVISRPGVGVDNIDLEAATERGIPVVVAPGGNTRSVAEHALAMILAVSKDLLRSDSKTRAGDFAGVRAGYKAFEVLGKTLGIAGFGAIGRELAKLASAIGMNVIVYDPYVDAAAATKLGYKYETKLDELLRQSDAVSLHTPLTAETRTMIGARELKLMKPGAMLINCARGELVDEDALFEALANHRIYSAAVDVLAKEPFDLTNPLFKLDNFIVTPHMAGISREAAAKCSMMAAEGLLAILAGEKWPHVANGKVYDHPIWKK